MHIKICFISQQFVCAIHVVYFKQRQLISIFISIAMQFLLSKHLEEVWHPDASFNSK